jgi:hypothetical protein
MATRLRFSLFFFSLLFGALTFATDPIDLEKLEYENARDIAFRVLHLYPKEKYTYVGIGRSMTPLVAILKEINPDNISVLPLSNMYHRPGKHEDYDSPLSTEVEKRLFEHFERFLPSPTKTQGKEVLFLDFVIGGGSAVATEEYLTKFAKEKRPDIKVKMLIFSPYINPEKISKAEKDYDVISTRDYEVLSQRWMFSWFDKRAEFGNFSYPFEGSETLKVNESQERQQFLEHYRTYMRADVELRAFVLRCFEIFKKLNPKSEI